MDNMIVVQEIPYKCADMETAQFRRWLEIVLILLFYSNYCKIWKHCGKFRAWLEGVDPSVGWSSDIHGYHGNGSASDGGSIECKILVISALNAAIQGNFEWRCPRLYFCRPDILRSSASTCSSAEFCHYDMHILLFLCHVSAVRASLFLYWLCMCTDGPWVCLSPSMHLSVFCLSTCGR